MSQDVCAFCAKGEMGCTSCCVSPFTEEDPGFWLTLSDVARIVKKTGIDADKFCRFTKVEEGEEDDEDADEIYGDLMYLGEKVILMNPHPKEKKCYFLTDKGCSIFDVRSKMCRIFPFWFEEKKGDIKITIEHEDDINEDDCYLSKSNYKSQDIPYLLSLMGENEEDFKELIKEYIKEMKQHDKDKKDLNKKSIMQVLKEKGYLD